MSHDVTLVVEDSGSLAARFAHLLLAILELGRFLPLVSDGERYRLAGEISHGVSSYAITQDEHGPEN